MNRKSLSAYALAMAIAVPSAWAQVCPPASTTGLDTDNDGFIDVQEQCGITLGDGSSLISDPTTKDVFVIVALASNSLILQIFQSSSFNPFNTATYSGSGVNVSFRGLAPLGLNVHVLTADTLGNRLIDSTGVSIQKAVRVAESTDTNGTILGNCQWGTPNGLDGCVVYSQRIKNFIDSTCAGNTAAERDLMFKAYVTQSFLHEVGHSLGGLAADYNSRFGGYHYKSGSSLVMEQSIAYSAKGGKCTWYLSSGWNQTLDTPAVELH
jgi:hypothetical protein